MAVGSGFLAEAGHAEAVESCNDWAVGELRMHFLVSDEGVRQTSNYVASKDEVSFQRTFSSAPIHQTCGFWTQCYVLDSQTALPSLQSATP